MKILITGATGFIGNHLIYELLKDKSNIIIATSRNKNKAQTKSWYNKVKYIEYDISSNSVNIDLYKYFSKPDILIHLSWKGLPRYNNSIHIEENIFSNYNFIKNLTSNGLKNITVTGTCFEYGMINGMLSEDMNTQPSNSYAIAKDTLRRMIEELKKNYEFSFKWIRLFYMYGKGQSENSLFSLIDNAIRNKNKEFNMSGGEQLRDYLSIEDVALNIVQISKQNNVNNIINCCSGQPISILNLVESYLEKKEYKLKLNLGYYPYPDYEPMAFWGKTTKLESIKKDL